MTYRILACLPLLAAIAGAQTPLLQLRGNAASPLGNAVANCGDLDRDGIADVIVTMPKLNNYTGGIEVHSGRTGALLMRVLGTVPNASFGWSAAGGDDCNGDGWPDLVVGQHTDSTAAFRAGTVWVLSGRDGSVLWKVYGDGPGDLFGSVVTMPGDIDRDGTPDVFAGAPENGDPVPNYGAGYAHLLSGRDGRVLRTFWGTAIGDEFGSAVAGVGDVDQDGWIDLAVGSLLERGAGQGSARLYSGKDGRVLHDWFCESRGDHFGVSVAGVGDCDRDGVLDVAVGGINLYSYLDGVVSVFSGRDGREIHKIRGGSQGMMFGMTVTPAGDVNGDGYPDIATTDPADASSGVALGRLQVHSGRDGSLLLAQNGPAAGSGFGFGVASLGDLDGDGRSELAVSSPAWSTATQSGLVTAWSLLDVATPGLGCAAGTLPPRLDAGQARAGQPWTLLLTSRLPNTATLIVVSLLPDLPIDLGAGCAVHLDPTLATTLAAVRTDGAGRLPMTLTLPNMPTLPGSTFAMQAMLGPTGAPLGVDLSNGLYATVR